VRSGDFKGNATVGRKRKMRRIGGTFWTPDRDENLRRLEGEGLSAGKIAEKLGTTRGVLPLRSPRGPPEPLAPPCIRHRARPLTAACLQG
jgi:hypothetical protein